VIALLFYPLDDHRVAEIGQELAQRKLQNAWAHVNESEPEKRSLPILWKIMLTSNSESDLI
jgi:hypothetical protein